MKKVLLLGTLFMALLLTGCGNGNGAFGDIINNEETPVPVTGKRLLCTQKVQTVDVNMIADFRGDELTYLGLKYEMDLSEYTDAQIAAIGAQDMCSTVKASMSTYTDAFTNCKQSVANKVLVITADFDLYKLITGDIKREAKIEYVKAGLEKQNYKCTIN